LVDFKAIAAAHLRVAVDLLFGTARGYLDQALREAGCDVQVLHDSRNPAFGGHAPDPSEENLQELAVAVRSAGCHLGLATDGDADRYGILDRDGSFIEPNYILALLLRHLIKARGWRGGVARSVATSHLVDAVASHLGVPLYETKVGFKYLGQLITQEKVVLSGEESAGLSIQGHVPEKDGILAALLVTEMVAMADGKSVLGLLEALYAEVGTVIHARRLNFHLSPQQQQRLATRLKNLPAQVAGLRVVHVGTLEGTKLLLEDGSWLLVRPSGTEPVVRLYMDAHSEEQLDELTMAARALLACDGPGRGDGVNVQTGRVVFSAQEELAQARAARKRRLVFVALLAILISVLSMAGNRSLVKIYQMGKAKAEQYREIARLRQVNRDLTREVQSFARDPARVEAIAREELGLVKPGEVVYQFGVGRPTPAPRAAPR